MISSSIIRFDFGTLAILIKREPTWKADDILSSVNTSPEIEQVEEFVFDGGSRFPWHKHICEKV